jgi:hypothetical protein
MQSRGELQGAGGQEGVGGRRGLGIFEARLGRLRRRGPLPA